jgi:hypothetical protein
MYRYLGACFLALVFGAPSYAQTLQTGEAPTIQFLLDSGIGYEPGYQFPSVAVGASVELPISDRVELQGKISYTPTKAFVASNRDRLGATGGALFWITQRFAATAFLERGHVWASQYNLKGWGPSVGIVVRERWHGSPGRLYLSYVIPTGCQWGPNCLIQSSRTTGGKITWDHRVFPHWRFGAELGLYRSLNQGNPLDPMAGRTSQSIWDGHIVSRFEFPSSRLDEFY